MEPLKSICLIVLLITFCLAYREYNVIISNKDIAIEIMCYLSYNLYFPIKTIFVIVNIRLTFHTLILCNDILHFMFLVIVCMFYFISYSMID